MTINLPLYFAHGAGAGHQSSFLQMLSQSFGQYRPFCPVTFQYMKEVESTGKKRPPPRLNTLVAEFEASIKSETSIIVGGKSMGGRVATALTFHDCVRGVVCYGFPFHPPGKPEKHRLSFLENTAKPCLIFQGTHDPFGKFEWVSQQALPNNVEIIWIKGANHDFHCSKKYNTSLEKTAIKMVESQLSWEEKLVLR